jgi:hypothetical protein
MNPWLVHVANFRKAHPNMSYSECLKMAKPWYKKKMKGRGFGEDLMADIKSSKLGSKAIDYLSGKVKQAGYGR